MELPALAAALRGEAARVNERRLLVLAGDRDAGHAAGREALRAAGVDAAAVTAVTTRDLPDWETVPPIRAGDLLGTTRQAVVLDAHERFSPNSLGQVVGAVDGGGLLVLLTPPLEEWPARSTDFDESLAVPPFGVEDVTGHFRRRLVETLRAHPGVAVVDLDGGPTVEREGLTDPSPATARSSPSAPPNGAFPTAAYEACLTTDQARAVRELEALRDPGSSVVVEADRGRGKSSAAGLAAGSLAAEGRDVLVTAPSFRAAREGFERTAALLARTGDLTTDASTLGQTDADDADTLGQTNADDAGNSGRAADGSDDTPPRRIETVAGGCVRFVSAADVTALSGDPEAVLVDEAAALPVRRLEAFLAAPAVAFCTTVRGYEGSGRGFDVRFRDRLAESDFDVRSVELAEPIRYAADDPVETWTFRALMLDARPAVAPAVDDATPENVAYRAVTTADLLADEHLLREAFGLLVLAHYRTEPNDLARLLDAPNLELRALTRKGHVVSVALLAREGGLDADTRAAMYDGSRVRGNMLPDVLTSQLRDEAAAAPTGYRVMRIATHHAVRSSGLGSRLLSEIEAEARCGGSAQARSDGTADGPREDATANVSNGDATTNVPNEDATTTLDAVDWLGVGYGATPALLRFWATNGYRTVHFSTTRNAASGEYSSIMLVPLTDAGGDLLARHTRRFRDRIAGVLADPLRDAAPDVVQAVLRTVDAPPELDLSAYEWRVAAGAAYGPGLADVAPGVFRDLALAAFLSTARPGEDGDRAVDGAARSDDRPAADDLHSDDDLHADDAPHTGDDPLAAIDAREERLLVRKCLQAHRWSTVADELDYASTSECMRTFGATLQPIVDAFGGDVVREERERYTE